VTEQRQRFALTAWSGRGDGPFWPCATR